MKAKGRHLPRPARLAKGKQGSPLSHVELGAFLCVLVGAVIMLPCFMAPAVD